MNLTEKEKEIIEFYRKVEPYLRPGSLIIHFDEHRKIRKKEFHSFEKSFPLDKHSSNKL